MIVIYCTHGLQCAEDLFTSSSALRHQDTVLHLHKTANPIEIVHYDTSCHGMATPWKWQPS